VGRRSARVGLAAISFGSSRWVALMDRCSRPEAVGHRGMGARSRLSRPRSLLARPGGGQTGERLWGDDRSLRHHGRPGRAVVVRARGCVRRARVAPRCRCLRASLFRRAIAGLAPGADAAHHCLGHVSRPTPGGFARSSPRRGSDRIGVLCLRYGLLERTSPNRDSSPYAFVQSRSSRGLRKRCSDTRRFGLVDVARGRPRSSFSRCADLERGAPKEEGAPRSLRRSKAGL